MATLEKSPLVSQLAKDLAKKGFGFTEALRLVASHRSTPEQREAAKDKAKSLFWEILVRAETMHGDDLFVEEKAATEQ